jgi:L-ornithine N5-monooxygenase
VSVAEVPSGSPADPAGGGAPPVLDVLGIGFGPSNLALAIALEEHNASAPEGRRLQARFVEQQAAFGWHRGMLLDGATMQVSFLKDLVTMRNPASGSSFLSYLYEHGRLADFINNKSLFPSRIEFHDYLEWAAGDVRHLVSYGTRAVDVRPARDEAGGAVDVFDVVLADVATGEVETVRARNVVLATGMTPTLPEGMEPGPRVWHNSQLLHRLDAQDAGDEAGAPPARRFVVVGAGQSAAETAEHLHSRYPDAEVRAVFARYGYSPADDTSFANRIFDPAAVDHFYAASDDVKQMLMDYHSNTNYSVVDPELINELYRRAYQEKVAGTQRLHVHSASRLGDVRLPAEATGEVEVDIAFLPTGETETVATDVVVYATGYRSVDPTTMLGEAAAWCARTGDGELVVERDYRLVTTDPLRAGVYVQGPTEHTHGISSTLLSTTAVRAGEIVASLAERASATAPDTTRPLAPAGVAGEAHL